MLGFFIKSERAKVFRQWASQLILNHLEGRQPSQAIDIEALENRIAERIENRLIHNLKQDLLEATQVFIEENNQVQMYRYWDYLQGVFEMLDKRLKKIEPPQITLEGCSASFYLFQKKHTTEYKFGKSTQPLNRLKTIQATSGNEVTLVVAIQMPTEAMALELEGYLKKHFKVKRIRSEWFDLNGHDVNFIRMIAQSFEIYFAQNQ